MTDPAQPLASADLLVGIEAIADHLGVGYRTAETMHRAGRLPTFKQGKAVCARKTTLAAHFEAQELAAQRQQAS